MRKDSKGLKADLAFVAFIILTFIYFIFVLYQDAYVMDNFLIACVVFIILLITYFTSLTTGLVINVLAIFGYMTVMIYLSLTKGVVIRPYAYFWIVMSPALTTAISLFTVSTTQLQKEVHVLNERISSLTTLDEFTKLKNLRAYENDANVYIHIAKRHKSDLGLMLLEFKYLRELERLCDKDTMGEIILLVSQAIRQSLRTEDEIYLLDKDNLLFGVLLLTKEESSLIVADRLRKKIDAIDTNAILNTKRLKLEMRMGLAFYNEEIESPLHLMENAKNEMRYDV